MLFWIVDRATLFYLLLGMLACGFALRWWTTRLGRHLVAVGVLIGIAGIILLLTLVVVSDRQRLQLNVREMAQGVLDGNPDAVFKHLASDFTIGRWQRSEFTTRARETIRGRGVTDLYLWDFDVEELSRAERKGVLAFRVRAESRWGSFWALCRAHFVLDGNDWKMRDLQAFNAVANTKQPLNIPLP